MKKFSIHNTTGSNEIQERIPVGEIVEVTIRDEHSEKWPANSLRTDGWPHVFQTESLAQDENRSPLTDRLEFDFGSVKQELKDGNTVILTFKMPSRPSTIQCQLNHREARYSGSAGSSGGVQVRDQSRPFSVTVFPE